MTHIEGLVPDFRGKVRDIYDLGDSLLLVASDRISAFDHVLGDTIPYKGEVLTKLSLFWFQLLGDLVENHLISTDTADLPSRFTPYARELAGRFMLVHKARVFPVECIVRGYLSGSGLKEYEATGAVSGIELPPGLKESSRLPRTLFTPSTKAEQGAHDENITYGQMVDIVGEEDAQYLRDTSIAIYQRANRHAETRGVIIADTKFEFGVLNGRIILVDEVLTPDSSRFWPAHEYAAGRAQPSFDKQFVRDWLLASGWDRRSQPPPLPDYIVAATSEKYIQAYETITGLVFTPEGDA